MSKVLCDTNILIEFYKGNNEIITSLKKIGQENIAISCITAGELYFGALNKKELNQIKKDLSLLNIIDIDESCSENFLGLMTKYSLSHKLAIPDTLIAASSITNELPLFTLNKKDFQFIEGLTFLK